MKSGKEAVTLVTVVTPYRRVYPKPKLIQKDYDFFDFLESSGYVKNRYTLTYTVTSVTSVTRIGYSRSSKY